MNIFKSVIL